MEEMASANARATTEIVRVIDRYLLGVKEAIRDRDDRGPRTDASWAIWPDNAFLPPGSPSGLGACRS
jgi:hypothetical protein